MDITPKYIKMCDCPEIQQVAERFYSEDPDTNYWEGPLCKIWLPRQDELQEMIPCLSTHINVQNLFEFTLTLPDIESWEQLWIRFLMYVKFNKVWDDKKDEWAKKVDGLLTTEKGEIS